MDEQNITIISNGDTDSVKNILENLLQINGNDFEFPRLNNDNLRIRLWSSLFDRLMNDFDPVIKQLCLSNIRILSRDKTDLDHMISEKWMNLLLELAGLSKITALSQASTDDGVIIESLKCLCNLVFNSKSAQSVNAKSCMAQGIILRVQTYKDANTQYDIQYYDMRLLFIITALCSELRNIVREKYNGLTHLTNYLNEILMRAESTLRMNDELLNLSCEVLKVLYNILMQYKSGDQDDVILQLISICNSLVLIKFESDDKKITIHSNIVHILTCIPITCYPEIAPTLKDNKLANGDLVFDGRSMETVQCLVDYLQNKLSITPNVTGQNDNLSPILTVMHMAASSCSHLRKYLRSIILPPLKDVHTRPEEGDTIRNHLCRLLTTPVTQVRDLVAQFLFILCKENVSRMVKYTGYGNAAGLFATRGLLGPDKQSSANSQYSSDSDDSDTEEYLAMRHTVNPVTGCYEPPRIDPMAGCSEEQKEYEAMKLVNLIDQLNKAGIVQPCRIGADGRPVPVEHVLQLQEDLPNQQVQKR